MSGRLPNLGATAPVPVQQQSLANASLGPQTHASGAQTARIASESFGKGNTSQRVTRQGSFTGSGSTRLTANGRPSKHKSKPGSNSNNARTPRASRMYAKMTPREDHELQGSTLKAIPADVASLKPLLTMQPEPPKLESARIVHAATSRPPISILDPAKMREAKKEANAETMKALKNPFLGPMRDPTYEVRARTRPSVTRRMEMQVTPWFWPENSENDRRFMSVALACEVKLQEVLAASGANADLALPDRQRTAICCHILDQISKADGPFKSLMTSLKEQIFSSIFEKYSEKREGYQLEPYYELNPYFVTFQNLELDVIHLRRSNRTMQIELKDKDERLNNLISTLDATKKDLTATRQEKERIATDFAASLASLTQTKSQLSVSEEECNYLRNQLMEAAQELNELNKTMEKDGEIAMLRDKVAKLTEELKVTMTEREELKAAAEKMVPKSDYNILNAEKQAILKSLYNLKTNHATLQSKYDEVLPIAAEYLERKGRLTPRPTFESVLREFESEIVWRDPFSAGGNASKPTAEVMTEVVKLADRYKQELATMKKSYDAIAEELADMKLFLEGDDDPEISHMSSGTQFVGLGTHPSIPKYLRFNGKVRNRCLTRRDINLLIKDVWSQKADYDKHRERKEDMSTYVSTYLQRRFGIQSMVAEWGYNVIDALERFSEHDILCDEFGRILKGELNEALHHYLDEVCIDKVHKRFEKLNLMEEGKNTGKILKKTIFTNMRNMFPDKSKEQILLLKKALHKDEPEKLVEYGKLFVMTQDARYRAFCEQLRMQAMSEIDEYLDKLERHIVKVASETPYPNRGSLTLLQVRNIVKSHDPFRPLSEIDTYLSKGTQTSPGLLKPDTMVDGEEFFKQMCRHTLVRPVKRHEGMQDMKKKRRERKKGKKKETDICGQWGPLPPPGTLVLDLDTSNSHLSQVSLGSLASPMPITPHMDRTAAGTGATGPGGMLTPDAGPLAALNRRTTRTRRGSIWAGLGIANAPTMDDGHGAGGGGGGGKPESSPNLLAAARAAAAATQATMNLSDSLNRSHGSVTPGGAASPGTPGTPGSTASTFTPIASSPAPSGGGGGGTQANPLIGIQGASPKASASDLDAAVAAVAASEGTQSTSLRADQIVIPGSTPSGGPAPLRQRRRGMSQAGTLYRQQSLPAGALPVRPSPLNPSAGRR